MNNKNDLLRLNNYINKYSMKYITQYKKVLKQYNMKVKFNR